MSFCNHFSIFEPLFFSFYPFLAPQTSHILCFLCSSIFFSIALKFISQSWGLNFLKGILSKIEDAFLKPTFAPLFFALLKGARENGIAKRKCSHSRLSLIVIRDSKTFKLLFRLQFYYFFCINIFLPFFTTILNTSGVIIFIQTWDFRNLLRVATREYLLSPG